MKPIRITPDNAIHIEAALIAVNGKATAHTFTSYSEIEALAKRAEEALLTLVGAKKRAPGAVYPATSGAPVSNGYDKMTHSRIATVVYLKRGSDAWFLIGAKATQVYKEGGGKSVLRLTQAQADHAVATFKSQFVTIPETNEVPV